MFNMWRLYKQEVCQIQDNKSNLINKSKLNIGCNITQKGTILGNINWFYPFKNGSNINLGVNGTINDNKFTFKWIDSSKKKIYKLLFNHKKKEKIKIFGIGFIINNTNTIIKKEYINQEVIKYNISIYRNLYNCFNLNLIGGINLEKIKMNSFFKWKLEFIKTYPIWKQILYGKIKYGIGSVVGNPHETDLFTINSLENKGRSYLEMEYQLGVKKNEILFNLFSKFGFNSKQSNIIETFKSSTIAIRVLPLNPIYEITTGCSFSIPIFFKIGNIKPMIDISLGIPLIIKENQKYIKIGLSFNSQ